MRTMQIRYSKLHNILGHKNTLVTFRKGNLLYFGISRWNRKYGIPFRKKEGVAIAQARAEDAVLFLSTENSANLSGCHILPPGLYGYCHVSYVSALLNYFDNLDNMMESRVRIEKRQEKKES